eukprot:TRINITY_DN32352_c2_g1_i1.p1 TRINITY_DN32352_c2_g1~~TRINITY_DN32352_c2_g1_i1.p1  ORF type:complete len:1092 (+),score=407.52 TRINITY_DN32352_c2_g1_i1:124-3399(+)
MELDKSFVKKRGAGEQNKVRVMVRVRPFNPRELAGLDSDEYPLSIVQMSGKRVTVDEFPYPFEFDECFWSIPESQRQMSPMPFTAQEDVFAKTGAPAVTHALNGFHTCIFAYGQTGSGKTHTMLGTEEDPGVAPRLVERLFAELEEIRGKRGFEHQIEISFMEIYNEKVKDLFQAETVSAAERRRTRRGSEIAGARRVSMASDHMAGSRRLSRPTAGSPTPATPSPATPPPGTAPLKTGSLRRRSVEDALEEDDDGAAEGNPFSWVSSPGSGGQTGRSETNPAFPDRGRSGSQEVVSPPKRITFQVPAGESPRRPSAPVASRRGSLGVGAEPGRRKSVVDDRRKSWGGGAFGPGLGAVDDKDYCELKVRWSPHQGTFVEGLRRLGRADGVTTAEHVKEKMRFGMEHRSTAATQMNDTSSRSHAIFQICLKSTNPVAGVQRYAHINLVDLAGSERIKMSGAEGERFHEATRINLSLSTLRRVIDILIESSQKRGNKQVVPYRDSMLTWILSDSLGGNSKTSMVATVSPAASNREDTINTLKYAHKAKDIVNTVYVNEQKTNVAMSAMQKEIHDLRSRLEVVRSSGESQEMAELQEQLEGVELDYRNCQEDLERAERMRREHEVQVREKAEAVQQHEAEVAALRELGVEEQHQEEFTAVEETDKLLQERQVELEQKALEKQRKEEEYHEEKSKVEYYRTEATNVADRELAFRKEMLVVRRKEFALAFHKAFKQTNTFSTRERLETELRATTDRVAKGGLEIQAKAVKVRECERLCAVLRTLTGRAEQEADQVEAACSSGEQTLQEDIKKMQLARQEAEGESAKLRTVAKRLGSDVLHEREKAAKEAAADQEQGRCAQLRVDSVCNERDRKQELLAQLRRQLAVLRSEIEQLTHECAGMRGTRESMGTAYERTSAEAAVLRAERGDLDAEHRRIREELPALQRLCGEFAARARQRRQTVTEKRAEHDELKHFVTCRFFPTGALPSDPDPGDSRHGHSSEMRPLAEYGRWWSADGYFFAPSPTSRGRSGSPRGRNSPLRQQQQATPPRRAATAEHTAPVPPLPSGADTARRTATMQHARPRIATARTHSEHRKLG